MKISIEVAPLGGVPRIVGFSLCLILTGCWREAAVTTPIGVSAGLMTDEMKTEFEGKNYNLGRLLGVRVKLPTNTQFAIEDFRIDFQAEGKQSQINCCADILIDDQFLQLRVKETLGQEVAISNFTTPAKPAKTQLVFLAPSTVQQVTLLYKNQPAGKTLAVEDWRMDKKARTGKPAL